jgi:polysaccharide pyruvyl transferase WcaK-like protein
LAPKNTILSSDLAEELGGFEISAVDSKISSEFSKFIEKQSSKKVTIYTLRRFTNKELEIKYTEKLYIHLLKNSKPSILLYMEPFEYYDSSSFTKINKLADDDRLLILNFNYNPIHLYYYLKQYNKKLVIAGLQYHLILSGIIAGCKIWPIYYDNKVKNILTKYGYVEPVNIRDIDFENLQ